MKKKIIVSAMLCVPALFAKADNQVDTLINHTTFNHEQVLMPLEPTYLEDVIEAANWGRNWFLEAKGGASVFLGNPIGCSDLFGRVQPVLQVGLGKWFTPAVGGRVVYQGFKFKDANIQSQRYNNVHLDFLYNATNRLNRDEYGLSRWDLIPYAGVGIINQVHSGRKPFAIHYGLLSRYKVCKRFHISAELSGMTTFRDFDGFGSGNKLGDNMLNLSIGFSYTFGKAGWQKVVDAKPYMQQNEWMTDYINHLHEQQTKMARRNQECEIALSEYRKILEIEGLLSKYQDRLPKSNKPKSLYPRNDYSGLNSLRARLANKRWNRKNNPIKCDTVDMKNFFKKEAMNSQDSICTPNLPADYSSWNSYIADITSGKVGIGAPVYFFFTLATDKLTDESQLINLDELARIAINYNLKVRISGAADSATGTEGINESLSKQRASLLAKLMIERGVNKENIVTQYEGGINKFSPVQANRNSCVVLNL